jgi:hypothetical protein
MILPFYKKEFVSPEKRAHIGYWDLSISIGEGRFLSKEKVIEANNEYALYIDFLLNKNSNQAATKDSVFIIDLTIYDCKGDTLFHDNRERIVSKSYHRDHLYSRDYSAFKSYTTIGSRSPFIPENNDEILLTFHIRIKGYNGEVIDTFHEQKFVRNDHRKWEWFLIGD